MKNKLNIAIFTYFSFPIGYSGTNRLISYSRGLVELGNSVTVYIGKPTEIKNKQSNFLQSGKYLGIKFAYPFKRLIKSNIKVCRGIEIIVGLFFSIINIYKNNLKEQISILIISNDKPFIVFIISIVAKIFGIRKVILIVDEYPIPIRYGGKQISKISKILLKYSFNRIDGLVTMTNLLAKYYSNLFKIKSSFILPMTVESERFNLVKTIIKDNYIAYIGNLEIQKDGTDILIYAFSQISKVFPTLKLFLYGEGIKSEMDKLKKLVYKLKLTKSVIFKGKISRKDVPIALCNAKVLLLPRPSSQRAEGGFPTKLGEYLSTGVPVVVTDVGEISLYLENNKDAFIVQPDSVDDFAKKVIYVLRNPELSNRIGERGKLVAKNKFDYKVQSYNLFHYLLNL